MHRNINRRGRLWRQLFERGEILKMSYESIEKLKSREVLLYPHSRKIALQNMANFVHFWQYF